MPKNEAMSCYYQPMMNQSTMAYDQSYILVIGRIKIHPFTFQCTGVLGFWGFGVLGFWVIISDQDEHTQ